MSRPRFKPIYGIALVLIFGAAVLIADYAWEGGFGRADFTRVSPEDGRVVIDASGISKGEARFFRFLNPGNQEVKFLIARDRSDTLQVAFDAGESHWKLRRGFRVQDGWITDNKCDSTNRLSGINDGGSGCMPVPLRHRVEAGDLVVLTESDILRGWRYFR